MTTYNPKQPIKQWAEDDRPREKMLLKGPNTLSDAELLAILISTGTKESSAFDLAKQLLNLTQNNLTNLGKLSMDELRKIKGIGPAKAVTIASALELSKRIKMATTRQETTAIKSSNDAFQYLQPHLAHLNLEEFWVAFLNRANKVITLKQISSGGMAGTVVDAKVVFAQALALKACAIVLAHNHPSGNLTPSEADVKLTKQLYQAGKVLDIQVIDHLIITDGGYYSFADNNRLT